MATGVETQCPCCRRPMRTCTPGELCWLCENPLSEPVPPPGRDEEQQRPVVPSWDDYFLKMAELVSTKSKDPSTKVGVVIVGPGNEVISTGFNGFPRGVRELHQLSSIRPGIDPERWEKRPEKYRWVEHAERNAIYNAARIGVSTEGCRMYFNCEPTPCADCTRAVIQAGIIELIGCEREFHGVGKGTYYHCGDIEVTMLQEAGVRQRRV